MSDTPALGLATLPRWHSGGSWGSVPSSSRCPWARAQRRRNGPCPRTRSCWRRSTTGTWAPSTARSSGERRDSSVSVPASRATVLRSQLAQAAALAPKLTAPRAAAIFGQLAANDDWFAHHGPVAPQTDIVDADGLVYRYFSGRGFEFHPLGNFAALNAAVASKNEAATARLATALARPRRPERKRGRRLGVLLRLRRRPRALDERLRPGGRRPGLRARGGARHRRLLDAPRGGTLGLPRDSGPARPPDLLRALDQAVLFNRAVVLNAQLQSAISLADYAKATSDSGAAGLAAALQSRRRPRAAVFQQRLLVVLPAARRPLSRQLPGLRRPAARRRWRGATTASRAPPAQFEQFGTTPPLFRLADAGVGKVTFWVSKPSTVRVSAAGRVRGLSVVERLAHGLPRAAAAGRDLPRDDPGDRLEGQLRGRAGAPDRPRLDAPEEAQEGEAKGRRRRPRRTLPPLVAGAGLEQPAQAALRPRLPGYGAVRMTLVWPAARQRPTRARSPRSGACRPGRTSCSQLYVSSWPADDAGRAALAAYAAAVATQVPALHDLVVGPGTASASAAGLRGVAGGRLRRREGRRAARPCRRRPRRRADAEGDALRARLGACGERPDGAGDGRDRLHARRRRPERTSGRSRACRLSSPRSGPPSPACP